MLFNPIVLYGIIFVVGYLLSGSVKVGIGLMLIGLVLGMML